MNHYQAWYKISDEMDNVQLVYFGSSKKDCLQAAREASLDHAGIPITIMESGKKGTKKWTVQA